MNWDFSSSVVAIQSTEETEECLERP